MALFHALHNNWGNFLSFEENKENLQEFLSEQLIARAPENKIIVTAGGFKNIQEVRSSNPSLDTSALEAYHEEADTRVVLHCINNSADSVVVYARDTDILVLLLAHFEKMPCKNLWLKAGTYKKPKYFPIHELHQDLPKSQIESILAFYAIIGCDSVSFIAGHSKKSAWKVFGTHYELLCDLGKAELTSEVIQSAEKFICLLYNLNDIDKCDKAPVVMFCKGRSQENLPPTSDAALLDIKRANYQSMVWV